MCTTAHSNENQLVKALFLQLMNKVTQGKSDEAYKLRSDAGSARRRLVFNTP